jgi:hypothetical protein
MPQLFRRSLKEDTDLTSGLGLHQEITPTKGTAHAFTADAFLELFQATAMITFSI